MTMDSLKIWFVVGSQHLYGEKALAQVAANSRRIVEGLNESGRLPIPVVFEAVVAEPQSILSVCQTANASPSCAGMVCWMHTFSPAKMWIAGLRALDKPLLHLHTQLNRDLPWSTIDMDFMNLHQSAHGDREFGYICTRLGKPRKVVVGHWQDPEVQDRMAAWMRAAAGWHEMRNLKVAQLSDTMRHVACTNGDKVEAQIRLGVEVHGYGIGELVATMRDVAQSDIDRLVAEYDHQYTMAEPLRAGGDRRESLRYAARTELGLRGFLESVGAKAFTDSFEDLHGLEQLPGLAVQRLMADGYGFGAEGDWKSAAMVRIVKTMAEGLPGGTSFMEDYTYHLDPQGPRVLGAHMLELCPALAKDRPSCEIHPLGIGGKQDPVRLVFTVAAGPAVNVALVDLGDRTRILMNEVDVVEAEQRVPRLPVAHAVWSPRPDLQTAAAAWIYAGGPHHTVLSKAMGPEPIEDLAEMASLECLVIDGQTRLKEFKDRLRWHGDAELR